MVEIATFYRFVSIVDPAGVAERLRVTARAEELRGTVLVAHEGINGTLAGSRDGLERWLDTLREDPRFAGMDAGLSGSAGSNRVFHRLKVRVRDEIVALKCPRLDPMGPTGRHVDSAEWNRLLADPSVLVIDARNTYEIDVGTFPGAVDPGTRSFREFPSFAESLDPAAHPRIAMFCTGGVRCEKASGYLLALGFTEVLQLSGGILGYLESVAPGQNRFTGECFVFDQRVTVTEALDQGGFVQCHACRRALSDGDLASPRYREGIACPYCHDTLSPAQRAAFTERRRQVVLAEQRGALHVGAEMHAVRERDRQREARS